MATRKKSAKAEHLAAVHGVPIEECQRLLAYWDQVRGHGWMDGPSRKALLRLAGQVERLHQRLAKDDHLRHAVQAGDPALAADALALAGRLRGVARAQAAPGSGSRVRPDEVLLAWEAAGLFAWAHPRKSQEPRWREVSSLERGDSAEWKPTNAYARWMCDVLDAAGVAHGKAVLDWLRGLLRRHERGDWAGDPDYKGPG